MTNCNLYFKHNERKQTMIQISNLTKYYGTFKAVDNISLTVPSGKIVGFLGPNGAGKTTTIKMITGVIGIDSGSIAINNIDVAKNPIDAKKQIGFIPDNSDVFLRLKGIEYLNFMADIYDVDTAVRKERIQHYSEIFEMQSNLDDKIITYSHGMRQKITTIGSLIIDPEVWILDEPMTGLDPNSFAKLKKIMRERADNGKTVFFSTHVLDVAEKICDEVAIIKNGSIRFFGTLDELRSNLGANGSLEDMFLELTSAEQQE